MTLDERLGLRPLPVSETIERFPKAEVLVDSTGVGDSALEQLRLAMPRKVVQGLTFTNAVKASLIDNLCWLIERQAIKMTPDPQLLRELEHFEARTTESGNTRLASRGGYNDDLVVALALAAQQLNKVYHPEIIVGKARQF